MNIRMLRHFSLILCTLFVISAPRSVAALDLIVEHSPTNPSHFTTIQAAIDYAHSQLSGSPPGSVTYRVVVKADSIPYYGAFTPISNVPIIGSETARTVLTGFGFDTLIAVNNVSNVTIKNFTFLSAAVGISVANSSNIRITNNIFTVGTGGTVLQVQNSPTTSIVNNTFYQNGTAISTNTDCLITNNIFASNSMAIATTTSLTQLAYNAFHNNGTNGAIILDEHSLPNSSVPNPGPLFVDPANNDFHLQSGSPCHSYGGGNAGNPGYPNADNPAFADMGAYGGPNSDTIPCRIRGVTATGGTAANSIAMSWNLNMGYQVAGYHLYYGTTPGDRNGTGAVEGSSPVTILQGVNSTTLSNLPLTTPATPAAVTGFTLRPQIGGFSASWTPAANASGYKVYYSTGAFTASSLPATMKRFDGANISEVSIYGLAYGVTYYVAVAAIAQPSYSLTVTAFNAGGGTPGVSNESSYASEVVHYLGPIQESTISNVGTAVPADATYPVGGFSGEGIPGGGVGGCFIATAAYGYYSAPQVQVLRDFRDRYLLTNVPGRAFVSWYYRYGPGWAEFITVHPWCKPLVRLLLFPLVCGAIFLLQASLTTRCFVMAVVFLLSATIVCFSRKRRRKTEKTSMMSSEDYF